MIYYGTVILIAAIAETENSGQTNTFTMRQEVCVCFLGIDSLEGMFGLIGLIGDFGHQFVSV